MILVGLVHPRKSSYFPGNQAGVDALARFLAEEFVPHLESQYRTEKRRPPAIAGFEKARAAYEQRLARLPKP